MKQQQQQQQLDNKTMDNWTFYVGVWKQNEKIKELESSKILMNRIGYTISTVWVCDVCVFVFEFFFDNKSD